MEKKITESEKRQINYLIKLKGYSIEETKLSFMVTDNIYHYVYILKEGVFSFSKEYIDYNFVYLVQEFPNKAIEDLPKKLSWEDFQKWITTN